jgi:tRNA(Ile)-lysidine synthase
MRLPHLNRALFRPGQRLAVALSGGADSTALLLALLEANAEKDALGLVLSAIHIHHNLRGPEADADQAFVEDLCATHSIPVSVERVDTPARQQSTGEGLEEAARELRYAAFRNHLAENRADAIATAHTLDDQAETVLLKLLRGAWTEGLAAISPVLDVSETPPTRSANLGQPQQTRGAVLRPLLRTRRADIESFLRERKQPWRDDSSNRDLTLTRNRLRHEILPVLRTVNPSLDETLARTAEIARDDHAFWRAEVARILPGLILPGKPVRGGGRAVPTGPGDQSLALEIERLKPHPPALRRRLIRAAASQLGCPLNAEETAKLLALAGLAEYAGLNSRNGARLDLSHGLRAERSLRELRLTRSQIRTETPPIPKKM